MKIILLISGILMVIATLLPFLKKESWWIRSFDFPRLQIAFIIGGILLTYGIFFGRYTLGDNLFIISLALCLLYQIKMMYPYTPLAQKQVDKSAAADSSSAIKLLFANVQMDNREAEKLITIIQEADPDVILAVETNDWWLDQLKEHLIDSYPYTVEQPQEDCYGMTLFSRIELKEWEVRFLVEDDIPSIHAQIILDSEEVLELRCLHPRPPFITGDDTSSERDAELLIVGKEIKDLNAPTVVLGDLNDVAWSRTNNLFQDISGLLDPRIGRGLFNTFHAEYPFIRFPLDHSFHTHHFRLVDFRRLPYFGSDHFPVMIELSYEPSAKQTQEELKADSGEKEDTEEKIEKGKKSYS